jgi:hypothetical protein
MSPESASPHPTRILTGKRFLTMRMVVRLNRERGIPAEAFHRAAEGRWTKVGRIGRVSRIGVVAPYRATQLQSKVRSSAVRGLA